MFTLNFLRLSIGGRTNLNGDVSNFITFNESGSILNKNVIHVEYGIELSLVFEEIESVLNPVILHVTRGSDASIRGR